MSETFQSHSAPFGEAIPADNPHAVSVSLPTLADCARLFFDRDPAAYAELKAIYPRFGDSPYVQQALAHATENQLKSRETIALSSIDAAEALVRTFEAHKAKDWEPRYHFNEQPELTFLSFERPDELQRSMLSSIMKRLGGAASSRRAEDYLLAEGVIGTPYVEDVCSTANERSVIGQLQERYQTARPEMYVANSGMAAIDAVATSLERLQNEDELKGQERDRWIIVGNIYHDATDLLRIDRRHKDTIVITDVHDDQAIEQAIKEHGDKAIGILTEAVTNPLAEVPDIQRLREIAGDLPLVVDVSTTGSANVNALPYADVVVESLTKFAAGSGDVMLGSIAVNPRSRYASDINQTLPEHIIKPYNRDLQRFALQVSSWGARRMQIGHNVLELANFFEAHPAIDRVFWTGAKSEGGNYASIAKPEISHAGVITVELADDDLERVYRELDLSKGLSFGTSFTLNTAYTHIGYAQRAFRPELHRSLEQETGLNTRMMRVSVGTERADFLKEKYSAVLD